MRSLRSQRKLRIQRETLRTIADRQLTRVAGGSEGWVGTFACYEDDPGVNTTNGQSNGSKYCPGP